MSSPELEVVVRFHLHNIGEEVGARKDKVYAYSARVVPHQKEELTLDDKVDLVVAVLSARNRDIACRR